MATPVIMPRQGQSVESCIIGEWHKKVGDKVEKGDALFTYETDKATFDEESEVVGTMLAIFFEEGDEVDVLTNVCVIGQEGDSFEEFRPVTTQPELAQETKAEVVEEVQEKQPDLTPAQPAPQQVSAVRTQDETVKISPRARGLAAKQGVDILSTPATGPEGRIIERDVQSMIDAGNISTSAAAQDYQGKAGIVGTGIGGRVTTFDLIEASKQAQTAVKTTFVDDGPEFEEVAHTNVRKVIARSMHASLSEMAQLTLDASYDMTQINQFRGKVKQSAETMGLPNITINDVILFAVSRTLLNHPEMNAHYYADKMLKYNRANVAMAVDTPRGLLVPVLFNADKMSLSEISVSAKQIAEDAISGSISPDLLSGGTFTVTNLGTLGIESFTPVINPPQTGILGVNTIETKIKEVDGEIVPYKAMKLSLTFDHRALDGAPAARFLQELVYNLENFTMLLAK